MGKGSRSGAEAVSVVLEQSVTEEPVVIAIQLNQLKRVPLSQCIAQLHDIQEALANGDYETVIRLRGRGFKDTFETYKILNKLEPSTKAPQVG